MNFSNSPSYTLEITVKSAEELTVGNHRYVNKNVFVTISTENQVYKNQLHTKLCDEGFKPTWDEKLLMDIPMNARFIILEVRHKKRSSDKSIGIAKIPTSDFVGNMVPQNYQHCLCYRLRDHNGEPNGIINFSVNVKGKLDNPQVDGRSQVYRGVSEIQGYSNEENYLMPKAGIRTSRRKSTAAVVGVPAAWYHSCHA